MRLDSLQLRLVVLGLLVNLALVGSMTLIALSSWHTSIQTTLQSRVLAIQSLMQAGLAGAVERNDPAAIGQFAEQIIKPDNILYLAVETPRLGWLYRTARTPSVLPPSDHLNRLAEVLVARDTLHQTATLTRNGKPIGQIHYGLSLSNIRDSLLHTLVRCAVVGFASVAGLLMLQLLIGRWLTRPVNRLVDAAVAMEHGDYTVPLPQSPTREIATLSHHFGQMRDTLAQQLEQLREQQQTFNAIADFSYAWELWFAPDGQLRWVNQSVKRLTGYTAEECIEDQTLFVRLIADADRARVLKSIRISLDNRHPGQGFRFRIQPKHGSAIWLEASWTPIFGNNQFLGLRISLLDCTESVRNREELERAIYGLQAAQAQSEQHLRDAKREEARLSALLSSLQHGLAFIDADGCIVYANPRFAELLTQPNQAVTAHHIADILPDMLGKLDASDNGEHELRLDDGRIVTVNRVRVSGIDNGSLLIFEDVTTERATAEQLIFLAERDTLTGVYNRRRFQIDIERMLKQAQRRKRPMALLMFDLNDFKLVNDNHGHNAGDQVLIDIARVINQTVRDNEIFCRLGGDEFAVLLPEANAFDASRLAERIEQLITSLEFEFDGTVRKVSASIGIAISPDHADAVDDLVAAADAAMYLAKKTDEGGCWRIYSPEAQVPPSLGTLHARTYPHESRFEPTVIADKQE